MRPIPFMLLAAAATLSIPAAHAADGTFYFDANTSYLSSADIPAGFYAGGAPDFLDNLEDDSLNGGLTASVGAVIGNEDFPGRVDSVAADAGSNGFGRSWFSSDGGTGVTFTFTGAVLPTAFGLVLTDTGGGGSVTFSAKDGDGNSLGAINRSGFQDGNTNGGTAEDRFFGVTSAGGIKSIFIRSSAGGVELDHLQYGSMTAPVPEPGTWALMALGLAAVGAAGHRRKA